MMRFHSLNTFLLSGGEPGCRNTRGTANLAGPFSFSAMSLRAVRERVVTLL